MERVVVLGPGGAGKSTFSVRLGELTGLPVIELDARFWQPGLRPTPPDQWAVLQRELAAQPTWIMDGDLGPNDVLEARLDAADTVIVLDFSRWRCAWRALRRSRERIDFWLWIWRWRRDSWPRLRDAVTSRASQADLYVFRSPRALGRFEALVADQRPPAES